MASDERLKKSAFVLHVSLLPGSLRVSKAVSSTFSVTFLSFASERPPMPSFRPFVCWLFDFQLKFIDDVSALFVIIDLEPRGFCPGTLTVTLDETKK